MGVADNGGLLGLEGDYRSLHDRDGFRATFAEDC